MFVIAWLDDPFPVAHGPFATEEEAIVWAAQVSTSDEYSILPLHAPNEGRA